MPSPTAISDIMVCHFLIQVKETGGSTLDPATVTEVEQANGFAPPDIYAQGGGFVVSDNSRDLMKTHHDAKIRFRRLVDEGHQCVLNCTTGLIAGGNQTVNISGNLEVILRIR